MKRFNDYAVGDQLEDSGNEVGTIVSLVISEQSSKAFILVRADDGFWAIYSCLKDAVCIPALTRNIPEAVMRQFLVDFQSFKLVERPIKRVPVAQSPPVAPKPAKEPEEAELSQVAQDALVKLPLTEPTVLLPEFSFP